METKDTCFCKETYIDHRPFLVLKNLSYTMATQAKKVHGE